MSKKQFDPNWPFPQFDEDGKQLLPPKPPKRSDKAYPDDIEEALF